MLSRGDEVASPRTDSSELQTPSQHAAKKNTPNAARNQIKTEHFRWIASRVQYNVLVTKYNVGLRTFTHIKNAAQILKQTAYKSPLYQHKNSAQSTLWRDWPTDALICSFPPSSPNTCYISHSVTLSFENQSKDLRKREKWNPRSRAPNILFTYELVSYLHMTPCSAL